MSRKYKMKMSVAADLEVLQTSKEYRDPRSHGEKGVCRAHNSCRTTKKNKKYGKML